MNKQAVEAAERKGLFTLVVVGATFEVRGPMGTALFGRDYEAAQAYLDSRPRGRTVGG